MKTTIRYIRERLNTVYPARETESFIRIILNHVCHLPMHEIWSGKDTQILPNERTLIEDIVSGLLQHQPIQYLLEGTEFFGMPFYVNPHVLIPRPETEELVEWILADINSTSSSKKIRILDIGTGSGCIAVSLAKHLPEAVVYGMDISPEALQVARKNATINQVSIEWLQHDILDVSEENNPAGTFDIIVSNPPYITPSEQETMERNVLDYEPHLALFVPENQPLLFYERIAEFGKKHLANHGALYFETNASGGSAVLELLDHKGYQHTVLKKDLSGNDRMTKGCYRELQS